MASKHSVPFIRWPVALALARARVEFSAEIRAGQNDTAKFQLAAALLKQLMDAITALDELEKLY
jgi:hypothetical protein